MKFNEDTRVKIPTILHLMRLGYQYLSLKDQNWDLHTNIFPEIFLSAITRINPGIDAGSVSRLLEDVRLLLDNEDLGRAFFEKLIDHSNTKLIDFENFNNNSFHVVTELTCKNGDEEFRPDITLLINGMPLVFIEVKKPNNREGILAERDRINKRFLNPKFKRFANITQFMIFSNNMEYDDGDPEPIQGAFYASSSYHKPVFNYFREEEVLNLTARLKPPSDDDELNVLKDNNLEAEFLLEQWFPWQLVEAIGVCGQLQYQQVVNSISTAQHKPPVHIQPAWYYSFGATAIEQDYDSVHSRRYSQS